MNQPNSHSNQNRRILVIDDMPSIHEDFRQILCADESTRAALEATEASILGNPVQTRAALRFEIDSAFQGLEGLKRVANTLQEGRPYAVAFVDVRMPPGWDGVKTAQQILEIDPEIHLVICTAYSDYSWDEVLEKLGSHDRLILLKKPFDAAEALQMAYAFTVKWELHRQARLKTQDLERLVLDRTAELQASNQVLKEARMAALNMMQDAVETKAELEETNRQLRHEITERQRSDDQLRQAQKMEAVGQLASGVAHDFNNILTVIQGHASLLLTTEELSDVATESATRIACAAERAGSLTRQLLAFSRKQVMQPKDLDLNELVSHVAKMLGRLLGEHIQLHLELSPRLPLIHADGTMMDQVLLNLAVNARDAMPKNGRLILRTEPAPIDAEYARAHPEAKAGPHVRLSVIDTGCGISPEDLPRIFEPFFTTKEAGKGTGLGLATVYGVVKQHDGWINVYSEVGHGTTFQVYLPSHDRPRQSGDTARLENTIHGGAETILVVEDQSEVRELIQCVLEQYGYKILSVGNGVEALSVWRERHETIDLVLTDMIMPEGLSGFDLAAKLLIEKPNLKIIFSSGYSPDIFGKEVTWQEGLKFLQKPYQPRQLAKVVRACLDAQEAGSSASLVRFLETGGGKCSSA